MELILYKQVGIALLLGFLIGLEREHTSQTGCDDKFGGVRTFPLISLLGALAYIFIAQSIIISAIMSVAVVAIILISYWVSAKQPSSMGVTSEIAAMVVFFLGFLSGMEEYLLATAIALVVLAILHFKKGLHHLAKSLKEEDIIATLQFILIAFIVLPLLPNQSYGPYDFFNPYTAWLMVVLISALSYLSYVGIKVLGPKKGIGLTGFLAGFISSTALVLSFSGQSKQTKKIVNPYVIAVIIASSAMFFRILAEVAVVGPALFNKIMIPMLTMGSIGLISTLLFWVKGRTQKNKVEETLSEIKSPFRLWPAIKFGLFFVGITFIASLAQDLLGNQGIYLTSILSGIMDVDAITISMSNLAKQGSVNQNTAIIAITIAAMTNTFVKGGIMLVLGARKVAFRVCTVFMLMLAGGAVSLLFI